MSYKASVDFWPWVRDSTNRLSPEGCPIWKADPATGRQIHSGYVTYHAPDQDWEYRKRCHETACRFHGTEPGRVPQTNPAHVMWYKAGGTVATEGRPEDVTAEMWEATRNAIRQLKEGR